MCSYNQINGGYACENPRLNGVLKEGIGFDGYVMSDFGSVHSTAPSLVNGLDQELNRPIWFTPDCLDAALAAGQITEAQIDAAALRVVRSYIRGGLFDHPPPATPLADASTATHKAIARTTAEQGSVLLKNNGLLPLRSKPGDAIAVIGPTASSTPTNGISASSVCSLPWRFGKFADLTNLRLQGNGDALISAVAAANPNTVVVLQTVSAVEMPWLLNVPAVLETLYAGEQMGPALAALLFGDRTPPASCH
jgi:beta-glucosidase